MFEILRIILDIAILVFAGWVFCHGIKIETSGIEIVLNGIGWFFKKDKFPFN